MALIINSEAYVMYMACGAYDVCLAQICRSRCWHKNKRKCGSEIEVKVRLGVGVEVEVTSRSKGG